jgi:hypothetical protein
VDKAQQASVQLVLLVLKAQLGQAVDLQAQQAQKEALERLA